MKRLDCRLLAVVQGKNALVHLGDNRGGEEHGRISGPNDWLFVDQLLLGDLVVQ